MITSAEDADENPLERQPSPPVVYQRWPNAPFAQGRGSSSKPSFILEVNSVCSPTPSTILWPLSFKNIFSSHNVEFYLSPMLLETTKGQEKPLLFCILEIVCCKEPPFTTWHRLFVSWMPPLFIYDKSRLKPSKLLFFDSWMIIWTVLSLLINWHIMLINQTIVKSLCPLGPWSLTNPQFKPEYSPALTTPTENGVASEQNGPWFPFLLHQILSSQFSTFGSF